MNPGLYEEASFTAQDIAEGKLQRKLDQMLRKSYTVHSTHTVRAADGDDLLVLIFIWEELRQELEKPGKR